MKKKNDSDIITQSAAARRAGVSKQYISSYIKSNNPAFVVTDQMSGRIKIDASHRSWKQFEKEKLSNPDRKPVKNNNKKAVSENALVKNIIKLIEDDNNKNKDMQELLDLAKKAEKALREQEIYKAEIAKQKSIQEKVKTLQMKKEVAPIELVAFFFSFSENLIQRLYRRPAEIEADLEALFMAGEKKKATEKQIRELEAIVKDVQQELLTKMKAEGYKLEKEFKK